MKRRWMLGLMALALAGCQGVGTSAGQLTLGKPAATTQTQAQGRAMKFMVNGPAVLGSGGKIVNSDVAGVIAAGGGNLVGQAGSNVIAAGGGNVIAAGGGNFRVAAATDQYGAVEKAVFHVENAAGQRISEYFQTGADGSIELKGLPTGVLYAVARFKANGKIYRVATAVSSDMANTVFPLDPINAMVAARVRYAFAKEGKTPSVVTLAKLAEVWTICNEATVNVDLEALESSQDWADLANFYETLLPQITDSVKCKIVKDFMESLGK